MGWRAVAAGIAVLAAGYVTLVGVAWAVQRRLLYAAEGRESTGAVPADAQAYTCRASDGEEVHALELDAPGATRTVVYFHGNGEIVSDSLGLARELVRNGLSVLLVEYRGYGASVGGDPTEEGLYADAEAALRQLATRGADASHVVLWGTSLGSGVAAEMAVRGHGSALILVSPYTSMVDVAAYHFRWLPFWIADGRWLVRDHYDTLSKAHAITIPTLIAHGTEDEIVPFALGRRVADAIAGSHFLAIEGGHHNDLFTRQRGPRLFAELAGFALGRSP